MYAKIPKFQFKLSPITYDLAHDCWCFSVEFGEDYNRRYYELNHASNGIDRVIFIRNTSTKDIEYATVYIKRNEDQHCVWMEVQRAYDFLLQEN